MTRQRLTFNLLGPQGSGKGTQAKALTEHFDLFLFDAGENLRQIRETGSPLGKEVASYIDSGNRVPPQLIANVTYKSLSTLSKDQDILFDGLLRSLEELEAQKKTFTRLSLPLPAVIFLDLDEETAVERVAKRRICVGCGARESVIHTEQEAIECTLCGGRMEARHDDTPEAIRQRLSWYKRDTLPVVDYFRAHGTVIDVDSRPPIEVVSRDLVQKIADYYRSQGLTPPKK